MRKNRLAYAKARLKELIENLAFENILVSMTDEEKHWKLYYRGTRIADYWPASGKGKIIGDTESSPCSSPAQAQRLAVTAKRRLIRRMEKAFSDQPHEQSPSQGEG
jgi:hypothetical protein